jgi:hypothetical protein
MTHGDLETFIWVDTAGIVTRERTSVGLEIELATGRDRDKGTLATLLFPEMIGSVDGPPWPSQLVVEILPEKQLPKSQRQTMDSHTGFYTLRSGQRGTGTWEAAALSIRSGSRADNPSGLSGPTARAVRDALGTDAPESAPVETLARWVFKHIAEGPPLWPISVEEILEKRRGDDLARALVLSHLLEAVGYQTEILYGLSLRRDVPRFHAWLGVCRNGKCVEVDPSIETLLPDATMVCLRKGPVEGSPYELRRIFGITGVRIVEVRD